MATIKHLKNPENPNKTLCGRDTTFRLSYTTPENALTLGHFVRLCKRCQTTAERTGLIRPAHINEDGEIDFDKVYSGDKQHDDWLLRLGVG